MMDVTGFEPATPCLQSVNWAFNMLAGGMRSCTICAACAQIRHLYRVLRIATAFDPDVNQIVHQISGNPIA
jgi:hypothetical protein